MIHPYCSHAQGHSCRGNFLVPLVLVSLWGTCLANANSGTHPPAIKVDDRHFEGLWEGRTGTPLGTTRLCRLHDNPKVWLLDFADLPTQAQALNRLAALVEMRNTPRDRVLGDKELAAFLAHDGKDAERLFLGHDYHVADIARFFNLAERDKVSLNATEKQLEKVLEQQGMIRRLETGEWAVSGAGFALVSVAKSTESPSLDHLSPSERATTLRHELSHGEFFTNAAYRRYCAQFWSHLSTPVRQEIAQELAFLGYDEHNQELVLNEMQAFLWEPERGGFIDLRLRRLNTSLKELREQFLKSIDTSNGEITDFFNIPGIRDVWMRVESRQSKRTLEKKRNG